MLRTACTGPIKTLHIVLLFVPVSVGAVTVTVNDSGSGGGGGSANLTFDVLNTAERNKMIKKGAEL